MDAPGNSEWTVAEPTRRQLLQLGAGAVALSFVAPIVGAQAYPAKPIKVIVPNLAGSGIDVAARAVMQRLSTRLGQPLIIDNRAGAGTSLGTKTAAAADPDGYTLFAGSIPTLVISAALYAIPGYDPIRSFAPVASLSGGPFYLVVHPSVPAKTLHEFIAFAKANPGTATFGFQLATHPHILGEHFKIATGAEIASVPYRASAQSLTDLLGGRIQMNVGPASTLLPLIQQGKVTALAFTGRTRSRELPDVPTMAECGFPQLTSYNWQAVLAPAGTGREVIERLRRAINKTLDSADVQAALEMLGAVAEITSPEELAERMAVEARTWPPIVKAIGLKPE